MRYKTAILKSGTKADQYHANGLSPMTWLITIARNTSIDYLRTQRTDHHTQFNNCVSASML